MVTSVRKDQCPFGQWTMYCLVYSAIEKKYNKAIVDFNKIVLKMFELRIDEVFSR